MNLPKSKPRILVLSLAALCALPVLAPVLRAKPLVAQQRGPVQRIVHGKVTDKAGSPIKGAVVYLQDDHTSAVKSFIAGDDGTYRFVQLSGSTDYTLWAKAEGKRSPNRAVSSFDSRNDFLINLKIE